MNSETRNCQSCKKNFVIEPEDFAFYERMTVPPPTWCFSCRLTRRLIWRNERNLSKRTCDLCKNNILSVHSSDVKFPVYCPECWRSDAWDPLSYGQDYDFSKPFFVQFRELMDKVPWPALSQNGANVNVDYANQVQDVKNVYFSFSVIWGSEDVYYSNNVDKSRQIVDSFNVSESEMIYESIGSVKNYRSSFCYWSSSCLDCLFILDSIGCSNCVGCVGLRNRQYCIFNEQYGKDEYEKKVASFNLNKYSEFRLFEKRFWDFAVKIPRKYARITNSVNCSGDEILNSKNVRQSFNVSPGAEDSKYLFRCLGSKNAMDASHLGKAEFVYEHSIGGSDPGQELRFIIWGMPGQNHVSYAGYCGSSSYLFGCLGMRNKEYCILNKQYPKDEYEKLIPKVIKHMNEKPYVDKKGRVYKYGEFFPPELCPFAYNESVMQEYIPLTKERAEELGLAWKEKKERSHKTTIKAEELPEEITGASDSITKEIIECENGGEPEWCVGAFRIIPEELSFYRRTNLPLPRYCPNCRFFTRLEKRNPLGLWSRRCQCAGEHSEGGVYKNMAKHFHGNQACQNEFETPYAPERKEIVYCEQCYQTEVI